MYAIVRSGSKQQKVAVGDVIEIDRTDEVAGASLSLPVVMVVLPFAHAALLMSVGKVVRCVREMTSPTGTKAPSPN